MSAGKSIPRLRIASRSMSVSDSEVASIQDIVDFFSGTNKSHEHLVFLFTEKVEDPVLPTRSSDALAPECGVALQLLP